MKKDNTLQAFTNEEITKAFEYQKQNNIWNFYDERQFLEELLSQRFNYLIVVYSLFITAVAGVYNQSSKILLIITFFLGSVVTRMITVTIFRIYQKVLINLAIIDSLGEYHVFQLIRKETKKRKVGYSYANKIIGKYMPNFCYYTMLIGLIYSIFNYFNNAS